MIKSLMKITCLMMLTLMVSACDNQALTNFKGKWFGSADAATETVLSQVTVYKSPTCGCCASWVSYLEEEGFSVTAIDHDNVDAIKKANGLHNPELKSCHTALVDGYVIEGHVPANDIKRLLQERPANVLGLTAPGMPMDSPGMNSRVPKGYDVLSFTEAGESSVYSSY